MRAYWTVILLSLMIHASMGTVDSASAPPKISVETPIYFSAADGSEMLLTPHVYSVQSRDPFLEMRPVGADRKETILLNATFIGAPVTNLVPWSETLAAVCGQELDVGPECATVSAISQARASRFRKNCAIEMPACGAG